MSGSTHKGTENQSDGACDGCLLVPRREFLRDAGAIAAGILVALGVSPARAAAAPFSAVTAGGGRDEKSYPVPAKDGSQIDKDNGVIVTRWEGKVFAFSLGCPHQNTAIRWYDKDGKFECPKHHSRFEPDGLYVKDSGRATRGLDRFAIRKDGNNVVVNLDKLFQEDDDETDWKAAVVTI